MGCIFKSTRMFSGIWSHENFRAVTHCWVGCWCAPRKNASASSPSLPSSLLCASLGQLAVTPQRTVTPFDDRRFHSEQAPEKPLAVHTQQTPPHAMHGLCPWMPPKGFGTVSHTPALFSDLEVGGSGEGDLSLMVADNYGCKEICMSLQIQYVITITEIT